MLRYLLMRLNQSVTIFFRTIRAFFSRRIAWLISRVRQLTNFTRGATMAATATLQSAAAATQKPTKREDYIETRALLVSKAFLIKLVIAIAAVVLLVYFIVWPFILGHFLTARFYQTDKRIENWTGRVIVYSDKKKTIPMYEGKLENGKLEDQGKEYDDNGVVSYEGTFLHGQRSGKGTSYLNGVPSYKGDFLDGVPSGSGISYNSAGEMVYQGDFAQGLPDGTGKAYQDGQMIYQGGFSAGQYSGQGTLYPAQGEQVDGTFKDGKPDGVVTWSKGGEKYYQGEWGENRPEGFGTLYSKAGKTLYQGQMFSGTLDGQWLLTLSLDDLKDALGDGRTTSTQENAQTFLLSSPELGLVARCSYQTENKESQVYSVYLFQPEGSWLQLLPGMDAVTMSVDGQVTSQTTGELKFNAPAGVGVKSGTYGSEMIFTSDTRTTLLKNPDGSSALLTWSSLDPIAFAGGASGGGSGGGSGGSSGGSSGGGASGGGGSSSGSGGAASGDAKMAAFMDSLDGMQGAGGVESAPNDYCGQTPPSKAIRACTTPDQLSALVEAMTDYWLQSETQAGLEENLRRVQGQLDDASAGVSIGSGGSTTALQQQKVTLEGQIESCQAQRAKAQVAAKQAAGIDPAQFADGDILVRFDPAGLDVSSLVPTAAAYAKATGGNPDPAALELQIKTLLVDMKDSYSKTQSDIEAYQLASDQAQSASGSYAMGKSDKDTWFAALSAQVDARLELFADLAQFTKQANTLNALTGGWVSRTCNWYSQEMGAIFENAIQDTPAADTPDIVTESSLSGSEKGGS